jgi:hypothetical protein
MEELLGAGVQGDVREYFIGMACRWLDDRSPPPKVKMEMNRQAGR